MSAKTRLGSVAVNAQAKATADLLNGGFFCFMEGDQPEDADIQVSDDLILARCQFGAVAFGPPRNGMLEANPLEKGIGIRKGDPTWCRCFTKDGVPVMDGSVGKKDANAISQVETIVEGQIVKVNGFRHIISKQSR